jgi:hypothetical protein
MFFGLTNSPATFQRMMNTIFRSEIAKGWLSVYMDDMAIHTKPRDGETDEQHLQRHRTHVHHILDKLEQNDLYLKPEKCDFEQKQIEYLGVVVGQNKIHMDKKKVEQVADWKQPTNPTEVRSFLGFTGYYCYFIKDYSKIARPLLDLTKKAIAWNWGPKQQAAFVELRNRMCKEPVLTQPNFERRFYLQTDAWDMAWEPYSHRREEQRTLPTHQTTRSKLAQNYTPLHIIRPPLPQQNATMTFTKESC